MKNASASLSLPRPVTGAPPAKSLFNPRFRMFLAAFASALSVCPQARHLKRACSFRLSASTCPHQAFYNDYHSGTLDPVAYLKFVLAPLGQIDGQRLEELRTQFMETRIHPSLRPQAQRLIAKHRERGLRQIVVTSTNAFIAEPIVQTLDIPTLIAPRPEMRAGQYTGELLDSPCFAADKPKRIQAWAEQEGIRLGETWGYSDSFNDIPLLEFVDHPVAVDPDPSLRAHAQEQDWKIISLNGAYSGE